MWRSVLEGCLVPEVESFMCVIEFRRPESRGRAPRRAAGASRVPVVKAASGLVVCFESCLGPLGELAGVLKHYFNFNFNIQRKYFNFMSTLNTLRHWLMAQCWSL